MKIGITQRIDTVDAYHEKRDCLDRNWIKFVLQLGYYPIPLSNIPPDQVKYYLDELGLDAIILSGGNSLDCTSDLNAEIDRDKFEYEVIEYSINLKIPLIGVCRGLQLLNVYFGGQLARIDEHVSTNHRIVSNSTSYAFSEFVNSFHQWGITPITLAENLDVLAVDLNGNIEAFEHQKHKILGIMWHPERENPFHKSNIEIFRKFLQ